MPPALMTSISKLGARARRPRARLLGRRFTVFSLQASKPPVSCWPSESLHFTTSACAASRVGRRHAPRTSPPRQTSTPECNFLHVPEVVTASIMAKRWACSRMYPSVVTPSVSRQPQAGSFAAHIVQRLRRSASWQFHVQFPAYQDAMERLQSSALKPPATK